MSENAGKFEKTFDLAIPVAGVWQAFTDPQHLEAWLTGTVETCDVRPGGQIAWDLGDYGPLVWEIIDVEPERSLIYREGPGILPVATEITVTFEASGTGTRLSITQSGFGPGDDWQGHLDNVGLGWTQTLAAMELYLRTGVRYDRFFTFKSDVGLVVHEQLAGPEVLSVTPGSFADHAGVRSGDIIVQLGDAPIFDRSDIWLFTREHEIGEEHQIVYVRDRKLCHGQAVLTPPM
jgi:uncharacterized protein YndB with AHSA1/START domain